jgi:hypothetical protein
LSVILQLFLLSLISIAMLLPRIIALLSLGFSASAITFEFNRQNPLVITEEDPEYPVPGDNPLLFCADPDDYLLTISKVDLAPNPPAA